MSLPFKLSPAHLPLYTLIQTTKHPKPVIVKETIPYAKGKFYIVATDTDDYEHEIYLKPEEVTGILKRGKHSSIVNREPDFASLMYQYIQPSITGKRYRIVLVISDYLKGLAYQHYWRQPRYIQETTSVHPTDRQISDFFQQVMRPNVENERLPIFSRGMHMDVLGIRVDHVAARKWVKRNYQRLIVSPYPKDVEMFDDVGVSGTEQLIQETHQFIFGDLE